MAFEIILFSIPEALVVTWLVKVLSGVKLSRSKVICIGFLTGVCTGLLRLVINSLVLSMVSYAAIVVILFWLFRATEIWKIAVSVCISLPAYLLVEFISVVVIQEAFISTLQDNLLIKFFVFLPQLLIMGIIVFLLSRGSFTLFVEDFFDGGV